MSADEDEGPAGEARDTLERLYDDPDSQISKLMEQSCDDEAVESAAAVFQALSNEKRLQLLEALREEERCGCELRVILDAPQSTVSTHLSKLSEAGLVKNRKKGRWNYYRIADPAVADIIDLAVAVRA